MDLKAATSADKVKTLGQHYKIFTRHDMVIKGRIEAYDLESYAIGLSNVLIETKGQGNKNQQKEEAVIVFEKDIKKMFPVDNHPHVRHSNKENVGNQKSKPSFPTDRMAGKIENLEFQNDRDYMESKVESSYRDLQEWEHDEEHPYDSIHDLEVSNEAGWAPTKMFEKNEALGMKTTYQGIESYSTAKPQGDSRARKRAEAIALEIEKSAESQWNAKLENDDEERDLDKKTQFNEKDIERKSKPQADNNRLRKPRSVPKEKPFERKQQQQQDKAEANVQPKDQQQDNEKKKPTLNPGAKEFVPTHISSSASTSSFNPQQQSQPQQAPQPPPVGFATPPVYGVPYGFFPQQIPYVQPYQFVSQAGVQPQTVGYAPPPMYGFPYGYFPQIPQTQPHPFVYMFPPRN